MTLELPVLTLGLAGFSADQQLAISRMLVLSAGEANSWEIAEVDVADAIWVNGARMQIVGTDRIRVSPGVPSARSLQFDLSDIDRPIAFAQPLPPDFQALCSFDPDLHVSMVQTLRQFETWLAPLIAQFSLASHIAEHQTALSSGRFELKLNSQLLAVVDMHGDAAVRSTARPDDFDAGAMWDRSATSEVPEHFVRASLSELMWQYAIRTQRDLLPRHYRTGLLYFRRAPRVTANLLKDSHLLLMRELMLQPASFADLQQRCGMDDERMARELAALYIVGTITSNAKRAARSVPRQQDPDSSLPNSHLNLDSIVPSELPAHRRPVSTDLTAPAPLRPDH